MNAVLAWINGNRDFAAGVELYRASGGKSFFLTMFENGGPNEYNKGKLLAELQRIGGAAVATNDVTTIVNPEPPKPAPSLKPTPDVKADNRRYLDLVRNRKDLYTELNMLMMRKQFLPEGEELRQCAFAIIKTHQAIREKWMLLDYYQEYQCFPTSPVKPVLDDKKAAQYLRQAISKAKTRLKSANCRNRAATELLLKEKEAELAELLYKPQ